MSVRTTKVSGRYPITKGGSPPPVSKPVVTGVPKRDIRSSLAGRGPIPLAWLTIVLALVTEQLDRIGTKRVAARFSHLEALVVSRGLAGAEKVREQGVAQLAKLAVRTATIRAAITRLEAEKVRLDTALVTGAHGELQSVSAAKQRMSVVAATVTKETDAGSLQHRRVPRRLRRMAVGSTLVDFTVLLYFVGEVFNVPWAGLTDGSQSIGGVIVPLMTSVVFAFLGSAVVAISLLFFGRELITIRDRSGNIRMPKGQAAVMPWLFLGLSALVACSTGATMAYRIISDALAAGNGGAGAAILGSFFSVIVVALNVVTFSAHLRDGSVQTEEIDHHAGQLRSIYKKQERLQHRIGCAKAKLKPLHLKGQQIHTRTLAKMGDAIKAADQVRLLARSYHQGVGWEAELLGQNEEPTRGLLEPVVLLNTSALDQLLRQLDPMSTETTPVVSDDSTERKDAA